MRGKKIKWRRGEKCDDKREVKETWKKRQYKKREKGGRGIER